jgi:hypothetical protein
VLTQSSLRTEIPITRNTYVMKSFNLIKNVFRARLLLLAIITAAVLLTAVTTLYACKASSTQSMVRLTISSRTTSSSAVPASSSSAAAATLDNSQQHETQWPPASAFKTPAAGSPLPTGKYSSQIGQDKFIDNLLHGMTNGFFVESGAHDGTVISNTVFLEANRNWTGLLVEANPVLFETLMSRSNRTASAAINACLSPTGKREVLDFALGGFLGGLSGFMSEAHKQRMQGEIQAAGNTADPTNTGKTISVTCWPLHEMMAALGRTTVDYWR